MRFKSQAQRKAVMASIYSVKARAYNRYTHEPIGMPRTERINTQRNELFYGVQSEKGIKRKYESYWNDLNPRSAEVVKVISVKKVKS